MDLTLRKAALEVMGWTTYDWIDRDGAEIRTLRDPKGSVVKWAYLFDGQTCFAVFDPINSKFDLWGSAPAIESDEGILIRAVREFCIKYKLRAYFEIFDGLQSCRIYDPAKDVKVWAIGEGVDEDLCKAGCKALIEAAKGQSK